MSDFGLLPIIQLRAEGMAILRGSGADEVQSAIRAAHAGGMVFGARLAGRVAALFAAPSGRRLRSRRRHPQSAGAKSRTPPLHP